ncbi:MULTISPECIES: serine O-acetyltransferase [Agrobacterium]|jgi:serine O-acetyltransferase|uniref:serine O-acetyltransferase n=1 Tax=Agrobacterium TaxID=357 RepID=UPI002301D9A9|nr:MULTISPECIES: serine O-acetyltransferase [Agrobacterium]MDA5640869.1 serine O-acetyltransferase [Agrobacterium sp. ST15.13.013]MDA7000993.1 serine O-acetyltransferase [Agrobacterium salinitolerans]
MALFKRIYIALYVSIMAPHILLLLSARRENPIFRDIEVWSDRLLKKEIRKRTDLLANFVELMSQAPEFRSLFYYRLPRARFFKFLSRPESTLHIHTPSIGPGLFIQHGFATIITAEAIGADCWINQQVTIGYVDSAGAPKIGNNVTINAGAKVLGNIVVGNNAKIGANAVVVKNVPADCTVVGVPARIIRRSGARVEEAL